MRISGTFLDEITCDIPSNNWGTREWDRDFFVMQRMGIDTVIMIRSGLGRNVAFSSRVLEQMVHAYPVERDYAQLFLDLAEKHGLKFYFPTYDTGRFWSHGETAQDLAINLRLIPEVWERYGNHPAFAGWYLAHEFSRYHAGMVEMMRTLGGLCKEISNGLPTIMSPYIQGPKASPDDQLGLNEHCREWTAIMERLRGAVDVIAFQDGHVEYESLRDYIEANKAIAGQHGMVCWSNVESFDRDMPIRFPPIDWRKLWWKLQNAEQANLSKLITFEFSHFMSPYSLWPSARSLFLRYCEWLGLDGNAIIADADRHASAEQ